MGKSKRNKQRRDAGRWPAYERLAVANEDVRAAERQLLEARRRAASVATNGHSAEGQAAEFFNRPGDYYIAQFEIRTDGEPIRAQCALKADEAQRDYLVEVLRQIRGAFGERARVSLSRAQTQQQRVVAPQPTATHRAMQRVQADHARAVAADAMRRRSEQRGLTDDELNLARQAVDKSVGLFQHGPPMPGSPLADDMQPDLQAEVCRAHLDADCTRCDEDVDDLWKHPRDLTRAELQAQLPGMSRAEVADELGVNPADIGGEVRNVPPELTIEELAAELGVSPLDLQPINMRGGGRVYAVKPRAAEQAGRHAAAVPQAEPDD